MEAANRTQRKAKDHSWGEIEFRHLAALRAVRDEGSFVDAAFELGYVQSAVSQQIAQLERIVGTRLVDRKRGAAMVSVTGAGELLIQHFDEIQRELWEAQMNLDEVRSGEAGTLRVGVSDQVASRLMPAILRGLGRRLPRMKICLELAATDTSHADNVAAGDLDVAIGQLPLPKGPFNFEPLLDDPYVLVVPSNWSIAEGEDPVPRTELDRIPLVATGDDSLELIGTEGYVAAAEGPGAAQAIVAAGIGAAIVPRMALDLESEAIAALDLADVPPRRIAVYWRVEASKHAGLRAFIEAALLACGAKGNHQEEKPFALAA